MPERLFNLFLFIDGEIIDGLGVVTHDCGGTDEEKIGFLQRHADADVASARRFPVPGRYVLVRPGAPAGAAGLRYAAYRQLTLIGRHLEVFEEIFQALGGPENPLVCVTVVVDGRVRIEGTEHV